MKAYLDVKINGHWCTVEVSLSYTIAPARVFSVNLGGCEIIRTLHDADLAHLDWCVQQDHMEPVEKDR